MPNEMSQNRGDLVLSPRTQALVLDETKGKVSVLVGPYKSSPSNTDQLVIWDNTQRRLIPVNDPSRAITSWPEAAEGQYIVLSDPAKNGPTHPPNIGNSNDAADLDIGRKVILPGPITFPLWPGQTAETIDGHRLATNQYVIVRVVQPEEARKNWGSAIIAASTAANTEPKAPGTDSSTESPEKNTTASTDSTEPAADQTPTATAANSSKDLAIGQLIVIKGTEISFYIPSTGLEVVPDERGSFVREAATLEQLEYCVLLDENGEKRYVHGPAVVFPSPTEKFVTRKARAIELNQTSGLYVKVTAPYSENGKEYAVGEELFITGRESAFYFPRPEHSVIKYGDHMKIYAIAIPSGEGRYVLDRNNGTVSLVKGSQMYLPDPRTKVVVKRIIDQETLRVMYPGNSEALAVNQRYRAESTLGSPESASSIAHRAIAQDDDDYYDLDEFGGDTTKRNTSYSGPRTVVLDTKYDGAVGVNVWPGYAVMVMDKTGRRHVEVGPKSLLLEYDESLMILELSTGKPKSDTNLLKTCYLRTVNNTVSDLVSVETKDLVPVKISVSYRVNFEGNSPEARAKWFDIADYVKVLTEHCRSRLRNAAKQYNIQQLYSNTAAIVRDSLLGVKPENGDRPGLPFDQNGMRLYDVDVLEVAIDDHDVANLLNQATYDTLMGVVALTAEQEKATRTATLEELRRQTIDEKEKTKKAEAAAAIIALARQTKQTLAEIAGQSDCDTKQHELNIARRTEQKAQADQDLAIQKAKDTAALERLQGEVDVFTKRLGAVDASLIAALNEFGDKTFVEKLVESLAPAALASGVTSADLLTQIFEGTPFESTLDALTERPFAKRNRE